MSQPLRPLSSSLASSNRRSSTPNGGSSLLKVFKKSASDTPSTIPKLAKTGSATGLEMRTLSKTSNALPDGRMRVSRIGDKLGVTISYNSSSRETPIDATNSGWENEVSDEHVFFLNPLNSSAFQEPDKGIYERVYQAAMRGFLGSLGFDSEPTYNEITEYMEGYAAIDDVSSATYRQFESNRGGYSNRQDPSHPYGNQSNGAEPADYNAFQGRRGVYGNREGSSYDQSYANREGEEGADYNAFQGRRGVYGNREGSSYDQSYANREGEEGADYNAFQGRRGVYGNREGSSYDQSYGNGEGEEGADYNAFATRERGYANGQNPSLGYQYDNRGGDSEGLYGTVMRNKSRNTASRFDLSGQSLTYLTNSLLVDFLNKKDKENSIIPYAQRTKFDQLEMRRVAQALFQKDWPGVAIADIFFYLKEEDPLFLARAFSLFLEAMAKSCGRLPKNDLLASSLVRKNGMNLRLSPSWQKDKNAVLAAVRENPEALQFASKELQEDKEILEAVNQTREKIKEISETVISAPSLKEKMEAFKTFLGSLDFKEGFASLSKQNQEQIKNSLEEKGSLYRTLPEAIQKEKSLAEAALKNLGQSYQWFCRDLKEDAELAKKALKKDGRVYQYLPPYLQNSEEWVALALSRFDEVWPSVPAAFHMQAVSASEKPESSLTYFFHMSLLSLSSAKYANPQRPYGDNLTPRGDGFNKKIVAAFTLWMNKYCAGWNAKEDEELIAKSRRTSFAKETQAAPDLEML